jgi:Flp pilus assembly protein TadG
VRSSAGKTEPDGRRGQTLVEFSIVTVLTVIMLLFVLEMSRAVLVLTTVAQAARAGVRYAIVHGSTRPANGCAVAADCASGPANATHVVDVLTNFASVGPLNASLLVPE